MAASSIWEALSSAKRRASTTSDRRWDTTLPAGSNTPSNASGGNIINLGGQPGSSFSEAQGINDAGQAVGYSGFVPVIVPEPSTWAMMLLEPRQASAMRPRGGRAQLAQSLVGAG